MFTQKQMAKPVFLLFHNSEALFINRNSFTSKDKTNKIFWNWEKNIMNSYWNIQQQKIRFYVNKQDEKISLFTD